MVRADPIQFTVAVLTKLVPFAVSVSAAPPAIALVGDKDVSPGFGLSTVNVSEFERPPPGPGFFTVTGKVPAVATSAVLIVAVSWVRLLNVVVRGEPFHLTAAPFTKPVPLTVKVNAADPFVLLAGDRAVNAGRGLLIS